MEPIQLSSRASRPWQQTAIIGVAVALAVTGIAVRLTREEPRATTVNSAKTTSSTALPELTLGAGDMDPPDDLSLGADSTPTRAPSSTTTTTLPRTIPSIGYPDDPDNPATTTTTVKPDPLIVEYATTAGGNPTQIAAGFNNDLWFTESNKDIVGRITTDGKVTEFRTPTPGSQPGPITRGPDGAMWFVEMNSPKIGRITESGVITEFPVPGLQSQNWSIMTGPDDALWFTSFNVTSLVGRITTSGAVTTWPLGTCPAQMALGADGKLWVTECFGPTFHRIELDGSSTAVTPLGMPAEAYKYEMTTGPDGALWFGSTSQTSATGSRIGRLADGVVQWCDLGGLADQGGSPTMLAAGPDGAVWFTMWNLNKIVRMTPDCHIRSFDATRPWGITTGPDGNIWFTEQFDKIGRIDLSQL